MHPNKQLSGRQGPSARRLAAALLGGVAAASLGAGAAHAQEMTHRFINPSFGGNPFYSDHLLGIANIHRPDEPKEPTTPPVTEEELLASQLRARLLSQLSSQILARIQSAQPGDTGNFELGNQRISFTRTATETRITFVNADTGETNTVVIPVQSAGSSASATASASSQPLISAEQVLGASPVPSTSSTTGLLSPPPL
jgi:curli production assembly/transport component CsgF